MANTGKRKTLDKKKAAKEPIVQEPKHYCCRCGMIYGRLKGYFPASHNKPYRGLGYLPFCSTCIDEMFDDYVKEYGDARLAMRRMCMKLDLYWDDVAWNAALKTAGVNSTVRAYITKMNLSQYIDKTYDDTLRKEYKDNPDIRFSLCMPPVQEEQQDNSNLDEILELYKMEAVAEEESEEEIVQEEEYIPPQEYVSFWGPGFTQKFYEDLERRYAEWTGGIEITDPAERALYKQIVMLEATIARDTAHGKSTSQNVSTLNTLLGSMNLKPSQKTDDLDADLEKMPLGVGIQKWEFNRPLPATKSKLKDKNGRIRDITTWFLGHACKMVGLKNGYVSMYEQAMEDLRVKHPEYEEEDDDTLLMDLFAPARTATEGDSDVEEE